MSLGMLLNPSFRRVEMVEIPVNQTPGNGKRYFFPDNGYLRTKKIKSLVLVGSEQLAISPSGRTVALATTGIALNLYFRPKANTWNAPKIEYRRYPASGFCSSSNGIDNGIFGIFRELDEFLDLPKCNVEITTPSVASVGESFLFLFTW